MLGLINCSTRKQFIFPVTLLRHRELEFNFQAVQNDEETYDRDAGRSLGIH
jgi:hypothetical protein